MLTSYLDIGRELMDKAVVQVPRHGDVEIFFTLIAVWGRPIWVVFLIPSLNCQYVFVHGRPRVKRARLLRSPEGKMVIDPLQRRLQDPPPFLWDKMHTIAKELLYGSSNPSHVDIGIEQMDMIVVDGEVEIYYALITIEERPMWVASLVPSFNAHCTFIKDSWRGKKQVEISKWPEGMMRIDPSKAILDGSRSFLANSMREIAYELLFETVS